jgi:hypothetical protein
MHTVVAVVAAQSAEDKFLNIKRNTEYITHLHQRRDKTAAPDSAENKFLNINKNTKHITHFHQSRDTRESSQNKL